MSKGKQVIVHMDDDLHEAVKTWSTREDRSMSAQVRQAVKAALPEDLRPVEGGQHE